MSLYFLKTISGDLSLPSHCHYKHNHFAPNKVISDSLLHFDFDFVLNGSLFDSNGVKFLEGEIALYDSFEIKYLPNWIDWGSECSNINIK